ncbi:MAG: hypothetical protein V4642_04580 [Bacteroidota bacterium]
MFSQENVGIGTNAPDSSAVLELSTQLLSSQKGFLVPRLTTTQRNLIVLPAKSLLVFNTTENKFEYNSGTAAAPSWLALLSSGSSGVVTSVGLSLPSIFTVSNSPVTSAGTLTATLVTQTANTVFAGPTTGAAAEPAFRVLNALDIPNLDAAKITTGTLPVANGGTGAATLTGILVGNGTSAFTARTLTGTANQITLANADGTAGNPTFSITTDPILPGNASSSGTFTAAAGLRATAGGLTVTAGAITLTPLTTAGFVKTTNAGVISSSASVNGATEITGLLPVANGGTGAATLTGILVGNGGTNTFTAVQLTGTADQITITNDNGTAGNPTFAITTNPILPGNASSSGTFTAGTGLTVTTGGATITSGNLTVNTGSIGIGTATPSANASLEISSTSKGFLPPRMTLVERNAIALPATPPNGLIVYVTDPASRGLYIYDSESVSWALLQTLGNDAIGATKIAVKAGNTPRTNTIVLADDPDLSIAVGANQTWQVESFVEASAATATPDVKFTYTSPTGNMRLAVTYSSTTESIMYPLTTSGTAISPALTANNPLLISASGTISTTASGFIRFQSAQRVSDATSTQIMANSYIKATRLR